MVTGQIREKDTVRVMFVQGNTYNQGSGHWSGSGVENVKEIEMVIVNKYIPTPPTYTQFTLLI